VGIELESDSWKFFNLGMDFREAFIALNMIEGIGPVRARSLLEHFGEAPKILATSKSALLRVRNIGDEVAEKIASWEKSVDLAGELKRISDFGCHVLVSSDENYPRSCARSTPRPW
jgi:DNA processing protein